jgi:oligopeptide transport system substrate-binding protein
LLNRLPGRKLFAFTALVFILFRPDFSAADVGASNAAPSGRKFSFRMRGEPETLDWNKAHTIVEADLLNNLMEGLVTFDSSMRVIPALAQSWTLSSDRRTYTFKLRPGVRWSDGVVLKAKDFVYSWKRLLSPLTAADYAYFLYDIDGAEAFSTGKQLDFSQVGIRAIDDLTLEVRLNGPNSHWIYIPAFWVTFPLRQDVVESYGGGWETPGRMVSLGPYYLESHDVDSKYVLRSSSSYYGIRGNVDQITGVIIKDDAAALSQYEAGQLDFLSEFSSIDLKRLRGRKDFRVFPQLKTGFLGFVTQKYPFNNPHLRRAIAMAIDKNKIKDVLFGGEQPATSFVPPNMLGYSKSIGLPFNPLQARVELSLSGFNARETATIQYLLPNWDRRLAVAQLVQRELKNNLGLQITLQPLDNQGYRSQLDLKVSPIFDFTWTADYPDPDNFLSIFLGSSGNNNTGWKNNRFDQLIAQARRSQDLRERELLYFALQKVLLQDEAVIVPLCYEPNLALVAPRVKTFELNSLGYLYLRRLNVGS